MNIDDDMMPSTESYSPTSTETYSVSPPQQMDLTDSSSAEDFQVYEPRIFTFEELAIATRHFSNKELLGIGDFGDVYKGYLPSGEVIAIKKLKYKQGGQQEEEFKNQIKDFGFVSHPNLVKLVGYCGEEADRLLVSEFVPNKSLRFHLSDAKQRSNLKWSKRMQIAIDSAKGLAYLHEKCNPKIIHQDIKSDNILLDNDFKPKVADFGLAKFFSEIDIRQIPVDKKEASIYKDSENSHFDESSDVYSFGVLLLELISGRKIYEGHISIVNWARPLMINGDSVNVNYNSLVDSTLEGDYNKSEMERVIYCAAASVYSKFSRYRPTMEQMVRTLEGKMTHKKLWVVEETQSSKDYEAYELRTFTFPELANATGHFTNARLLGGGGFGTVYRGSLSRDIDVAIKKLNFELDGQQKEEFEKEVNAVGIVRHRNLVKLVGYCSEKFDRLLVLEFVPNKSLRSHLNDEERRSNLKWSERMKIAIGSAKGLAYLHEECNSKIIHRDIKAENILLDNNYKPKIADFGLAKFFPETNSVTHISSCWKGTNVYADPENYYPQKGENILQKISEKSDVYSFGVVLLELITGRKIFDEHQVDIVNWAKPLMIKGDSVEIEYSCLVDSLLRRDYIKSEMKLMIYCAAASLYRPSKLRPRMKQIVEALEGKIPCNELWVAEDINYIAGKPYKPEMMKRPSLLKKFDFGDLATAAGSFSGAHLLRQHDLCPVYEGVLPNSDQRVAIKRLRYELSQQQKDEFKKEIMAISNVYHRNIVNLIGYCSDDDDNRLLVFEFVPNNSLKFHLHEGGSSTINWSNRMKIAVGSAKGLKYMHEDSGHKILHLYVKSDNILLNDKFIPKLAEFGSAKIFPDALTHLSISQIMINSGYMAPEYQATNKLTDKLDIYSFGVILLELITGKQPFGHFSGHTNMVKWAKPMLSKSLFEGKDMSNFVDEELQGCYDPKQMDQMVACVLACVHDDPQRRPPMSRILEVLEGRKSLEETILFLNLNNR
ncbi:hypothetical protein P3X46_001395 [Hevea brasiliensis]|uniref:non-specific serine/threonine protein kinase n=1 Tax=Hevea brasiliensis TaxID=3981 RepID=A0ABQ9NEU0_HEVBR|nr:uncharacterized protein LOC110667142 isoform X1 [Hevea brasiliensis]KAJ9190167.1 hypothetical protein P3X46_001395 [Hevea brasiliensis]